MRSHNPFHDRALDASDQANQALLLQLSHESSINNNNGVSSQGYGIGGDSPRSRKRQSYPYSNQLMTP